MRWKFSVLACQAIRKAPAAPTAADSVAVVMPNRMTASTMKRQDGQRHHGGHQHAQDLELLGVELPVVPEQQQQRDAAGNPEAGVEHLRARRPVRAFGCRVAELLHGFVFAAPAAGSSSAPGGPTAPASRVPGGSCAAGGRRLLHARRAGGLGQAAGGRAGGGRLGLLRDLRRGAGDVVFLRMDHDVPPGRAQRDGRQRQRHQRHAQAARQQQSPGDLDTFHARPSGRGPGPARRQQRGQHAARIGADEVQPRRHDRHLLLLGRQLGAIFGLIRPSR
jgi:hypothetical protein